MSDQLHDEAANHSRGGVRVAIVGSGISGLAAAHECVAAGALVDMFDMGENPGGRLAVRDLEGPLWPGHVVDVGAAFFTVSDQDFEMKVNDWHARGLAHPWSDECAVVTPSGTRVSHGRMRWSASKGLRSLARAELELLTEVHGFTVKFMQRVQTVVVADGVHIDGRHYDAAILACPDPQASRIISEGSAPQLSAQLAGSTWNPIISHTMVFSQRSWGDYGMWFIEQSEVLASIADDGSRRGDGAAVLVAHSTAELAQQFFDNPDGAVPQMWQEVQQVLGISNHPDSTITKRWGLAHPAAPHPELFGVDATQRLFVCGDGWGGKPRIEGAWLSGRRAARAALTTLGC